MPLPPERKKPDQIDTVVQPDLSIICDLDKIDRRGCMGAPDWIIEILSPGTVHKDLREKFEVYEYAGVREYWLFFPVERLVIAYTLNSEGKYSGRQPYTFEESICPMIFPDLKIELKDIFPDMDLVEEEWMEYAKL